MKKAEPQKSEAFKGSELKATTAAMLCGIRAKGKGCLEQAWERQCGPHVLAEECGLCTGDRREPRKILEGGEG